MALQPAAGAKDLNPREVERNRQISDQLAAVYRLWGYQEVAPPSFERLDTLEAGGGIGGLATALTLHQIGVPCVVFEAVREMKPLGVGINLQPNAVRELYDLGIGADELDRIGLPAKEWALVGLNGNDIYSEPRGLLARAVVIPRMDARLRARLL